MSLSEALAHLIDGANLTKVAALIGDARDRMIPNEDNEDVVAMRTALVQNRAQIDLVQSHVASLVLYKAKAAANLRDAKAAYDDAYAKAALKPQVGFADFSTAKEKDAHYGSQAVAETIELRKAENAFRDAEAVLEFARILLRAMEGVHADINTKIRLINLSSTLDR